MINEKVVKDDETNVIEYEVDESGALMYVQETEETHVFNETAYFIYKSLTEPMSQEDIFQLIMNEYEISVETNSIKSDIENCINMLLEKKIIKKI